MVSETPRETVSLGLSSLERDADMVSWRQRHTMRHEFFNLGSVRPIREVLAKRVIDCGRNRAATLSRAVFSDNDALIDYQATRPKQAAWQPISRDAPLYRLACGAS